jgi:hypothetical protein
MHELCLPQRSHHARVGLVRGQLVDDTDDARVDLDRIAPPVQIEEVAMREGVSGADSLLGV